MSTNFYGLGNYTTSLFDAYFGNNSTRTNSFYGSDNKNSMSSLYSMTSSLGDLKMIQSGVYKKALAAYYATQTEGSEKESISGSGTADSNVSLSTLKSAANDLKTSSKKLQNINYDTVKREDLLKDVESFVEDYNSTINASKDMNSYSILQTAVWATEQMNVSEGLLNEVGITVKEDNTLSINADKFKNAKTADLKALFEGSNSVASRIAQKASALANQSANQLVANSGSSLYNMFGTLS